MPRKILVVTAGGPIDYRYWSRHADQLRDPWWDETVAAETILKHGGIDFHGRVLRRCPCPDNMGIAFWRPAQKENEPPDFSNLTETIASVCAKATERAILITCDFENTLEYAAAIAERHLEKTIVLTGAVRPAFLADSDAPFNVAFGMAVAQLLTTAGVYVAVHGEVHIWNQCLFSDISGHFISTVSREDDVDDVPF